MATVTIREVSIEDLDGNELPYNDIDNVYTVNFRPKQSKDGLSPYLNLRVTCRISVAGTIQVKFTLNEFNNVDFILDGGNENGITYFRDMKDNDSVLLKFRLRTKRAIGDCQWSHEILTARDSMPGNSTRQRTVHIMGR